ncbi:DUF6884 domain-containing protein [Salinigranum sp. GCM10025319]|uniref:DUF6884 domain-containing protein n=1 Tax=Salinigranum sp. GCM10025319 TaxID=3252687 RepID=UPI003610E9B3
MSTLLVQSCSKSKNSPGRAVPAIELYSGYYYKIIKKAKKENDFRSDIDVCILSAKYGLIEETTRIEEYDQRMNRERAVDLQEDVEIRLRDILKSGEYERVIINAGQNYRVALKQFIQNTDIDVEILHGQLGERGSVLKRLVRKSQNS